MKRVLLLGFCIVLATACATGAVAQSARQSVSLDDVVLLAHSNISDQTIFTFLDFRELGFVLDAETLTKLREAGVSEAVIRYLLEIEASVPETNYTAFTDDRTTGYPAYYYGSRRYGAAIYPLGFYDHHYFGLGYTAINSYAPHYSGGYGIGYATGIAGDHGSNVSHPPTLGGHRSSLSNDIRHGSSGRSHAARHTTGRHIGTHTSRYSGGHLGGHSGGHRGGGGHGQRH